jgi:hypothetical protein
LRVGRPNNRGFLFSPKRPCPALGPTHTSTKYVPVVPSPKVKQTGREADDSPSSNVEVKNNGFLTLLSMCRDNSTFFTAS